VENLTVATEYTVTPHSSVKSSLASVKHLLRHKSEFDTTIIFY